MGLREKAERSRGRAGDSKEIRVSIGNSSASVPTPKKPARPTLGSLRAANPRAERRILNEHSLVNGHTQVSVAKIPIRVVQVDRQLLGLVHHYCPPTRLIPWWARVFFANRRMRTHHKKKWILQKDSRPSAGRWRNTSWIISKSGIVFFGVFVNNIVCSIVPSEDAHGSEYVAASDKRREHVSGYVHSHS